MSKRPRASASRIVEFIAAFNLGLRDHHALEMDADGCVTAGYYRSRLSSVFQPIREAATGKTVGHEGLIRCFGGTRDAPTSPWGIFALAGLDRDLVDLDRLCRTLHMLNYFRQPSGNALLFLNIELRLLTAVERGFGRAFEERLTRIGLNPRSIVIELPAGALLRPQLVRQAISDYRSRGYRVAASTGLARGGWPSVLHEARPDIVKIAAGGDIPAAALGDAVRAARDIGAAALAERLETDVEEKRAAAAGFDFLQGYRIGVPGIRVDADVRSGTGPAARSFGLARRPQAPARAEDEHQPGAHTAATSSTNGLFGSWPRWLR